MPICSFASVDGSRRLAFASFGDAQAERQLLFDPGSFGCYVDGLHLCRVLSKRGWRAVTYSRAGMYPSDPLPPGTLPDPIFHVEDMARLADAVALLPPFVLAGHSMAGVRLHHAGFVLPETIVGLAFMDAVCPALTRDTAWAGWTAGARRFASAGVLTMATPLRPMIERVHPNYLKLDGEEREEKIRSISDRNHLTTAGLEIDAMDRRTRRLEIEPALHRPAFFATATAVSRGTRKLVAQYQEQGIWAEHIHCPRDNHMSILTPPTIERLADGVERLWESCRP